MIPRSISILEEITEILNRGAQRIQDLPATGNYSSLKLAAANQTAVELQEPALRYSVVAQDFRKHVERATPGIEYLLGELAKDPGKLNEAPGFLETIYQLVVIAEDSATSSRNFAESTEEAGAATRMMKRVSNSIKSSALSMSRTSMKIAGWRELADRVKAV